MAVTALPAWFLPSSRDSSDVPLLLGRSTKFACFEGYVPVEALSVSQFSHCVQ